MTAPVFIAATGLGSTPVRQEISYEQWVSQTNREWAQANPDKARMMGLRIGGANIAGIVALGAGALAFAFGKTKLGIGLGVVGAGGIIYSAIATKNELGGESILKVGSQPGIAGW